MAEPEPTTERPRGSRVRLVLKALLSVVLVVAIFYYLLRGLDFGQVRDQIAAMTWLELATLAALALWNLATYAFVWMTVTPGLSFGRAMVMTQSTTAVTNTVPGGSAIGVGMTYSMLHTWDFSRSRTTMAVLVSGVWNTFIKLGMPVLALALVALQGDAGGGRVTAASAGIAALVAAVVVFALMLRSERGARRVGELAGAVASWALRLVRRPPVHGWELATVKFRARTLDLLEHGCSRSRPRPCSATSHCTRCCSSACATSASPTPRSAGRRSWPCSRSPVWRPPSRSPPAAPGWSRPCSSAGSSPPAAPRPRWSPPCWSTGR